MINVYCEISPSLTPIYHLSVYEFRYYVLVQSLLSDPNPASPANAEASQLYERDRGYVRAVRVTQHSTALTNTSLYLRYSLYHDDVVDI